MNVNFSDIPIDAKSDLDLGNLLWHIKHANILQVTMKYDICIIIYEDWAIKK